MHFSVFDIILLTVILISLSVYFQKQTPFYLKLYPLYFFSAFVMQLISEWLVQHGKYNTGLANVWGPIEFCFYFFVLHEMITHKKIRRIILYVAVFYALFSFINLFFIKHKVGFNPVNFTVGCLITVLLCIYYFVELFQKTEAESLSRSPAFWIASAILFNTVLTFPTFALESFLEESTKVDKASQIFYNNMTTIATIIIVLTFILYVIGFLCRIKIKKSSL